MARAPDLSLALHDGEVQFPKVTRQVTVHNAQGPAAGFVESRRYAGNTGFLVKSPLLKAIDALVDDATLRARSDR